MGKVGRGKQSRIDDEFAKYIAKVQAKYLLRGKRPPSAREITKMIAKQLNSEEIVTNDFRRL